MTDRQTDGHFIIIYISPLPGKAGEQLNHPHREGDILAWQGAEEAHQDREQIPRKLGMGIRNQGIGDVQKC